MAGGIVRGQSLELFSSDVFGLTPSLPGGATATLLDDHVIGSIRRQQWVLELSLAGGTHRSVVMVDRPGDRNAKAAFLGLNFRGNHACGADPLIADPAERDDVGRIHYEGLREPIQLPIQRGSMAHRWPTGAVVERGYAVVTACYLQLGPDSPQFRSTGIVPLLQAETGAADGGHDVGAISIWAWYMSRVLDAIQDGGIAGLHDAPVIAFGHSRLGKAALWATALDTRFAAAISNNSGCMGAALSRPIGETPELLAEVRPQWFASRFGEHVLGGGMLPVDQPELLAMIAPRPLYVASASDDAAADPEGEFLSLLQASESWGAVDEPWTPSFPAPGELRWHEERPLGYHLRAGGHELQVWDWEQWLDFTDRWIENTAGPYFRRDGN